jgi:FHA domain-containing protein
MRLDDIRKGLASVKKLLEAPPLGADAQPLEIRAAVVDAIEEMIAVIGVGRASLPYDRIAVRLLAPTKDERAALEPVFAELESRVRERLHERRCDLPRGLAVTVVFLKKVPAGWPAGRVFSIDATPSGDRPGGRTASLPPMLKVTVLNGGAERKVYSFRDATILVGRTVEATSRGHVRRNQVAFDNDNASVSRAHARFKYDSSLGGYRLLDEGSARGTRIMRGATSIPVPHDPRGVRVQSGDEIHFGGAVVRVSIDVP